MLATAAHPGYAATNLQFHSGRRAFDLISGLGNRVLAQDGAAGALPTLYAAVADIPGNSFAGAGGFLELRGPAKLVGRSRAAKDADCRAPPVGGIRRADRGARPACRRGRVGCGQRR